MTVLFSFQNHVAQCQFATTPCPQCQQSVRKSHLEEHTTVECRRRPVSCPDCVMCFVYEEREVMLTHLCNCSSCFFSRIVLIGKLGQRHCVSVRISLLTVWFLLFLQLHEQECPFANVTCQYCEMDLIRDHVSDIMSAMKRDSGKSKCFQSSELLII